VRRIKEPVDLQQVRGRRVAGKVPAPDEHGVAPQRQACRPRVPRQPHPRGARDAPPLGGADRKRRGLEIGARLDLDEGDHAASAGDKIDLAAGDDEPPGEDRIALQTQQQRRNRFGLEPIEMRAAPTLRNLVGAAPHRRSPASASARA
jgi:hypothetical protein